MFFSIFIRFSICVQFSMFRHDSISFRMSVDDSKYSIFLGKWIPSKIKVYQLKINKNVHLVYFVKSFRYDLLYYLSTQQKNLLFNTLQLIETRTRMRICFMMWNNFALYKLHFFGGKVCLNPSFSSS